MSVVAIITDQDMFEEPTVLLVETVAEAAACFGSYVSATGAVCCPPPPADADADGWVAWLSAYVDEDECCPVDIEIYTEEAMWTPHRHPLSQPIVTTRMWRAWVTQAAPAIRPCRPVITRRTVDVTASL